MRFLLLVSMLAVTVGCRREVPPPKSSVEQPPPEIQKAPASDEERIQGAWRAVVRNGNPSTFSIVWQFKGKEVTLNEGGVMSKGTFTLNPTASPKTLDLDTDLGRFQCLYEFTDDALRICFDDVEDSPRPTEFAATGSPTRVLFVFKRQ